MRFETGTLNELLDRRVKSLAAKGGEVPPAERRQRLLQCLGLDPMPPRSDLRATITGTLTFEGYRIEKLRYESRPGWLVTAHLYLPEGTGPWPVVLNPHGHWSHKKSAPWVQARGVSLALAGYAALVVDSPGVSWDDNDTNERLAQGSHEDWFASMGAPLQGLYVWDLMRGLDYLETRPDCDTKRVGITGCSGGGTATMYAFALDERIRAAVPVCYVASYENSTTDGCLCNHVAGVLLLGDRNDLLAMRAPGPVMVIGATVDHDFPPEGTKLAFEKLRRSYRAARAEGNVRLVIEDSNHDYNRRMRESMLAFFAQHLKGEPARDHVAEMRPITDGIDRPYPNWTQSEDDSNLWVTALDERQTITMRDLLIRALAEPYPEPFDATRRVVAWARHGKLPSMAHGAIVAIHDSEIESPKEPGSLAIPYSELDQRKAIYIGLSLPEFVAQVLHSALPGGPDGWEAAGVMGGDALTSIIASVKTLVQTPGDPPKMLVAEGPISSMAALFFRQLRPEVTIETSHTWSSWSQILDSGNRCLSQPGARYMSFPA